MPAAPTKLVPGTRLGDYEIRAHLACGGMADIYVARRADAVTPARKLAIKRLRSCFANQAEYAQMFVDEARLMAQLEHPNVVRVKDIARVSTGFFFAMELVHGESLLQTMVKALRRRGAIPFDQAIAIVLQVAAGLDYAHHARDAAGFPLGVVHRDVSPGNVLIDYDGNVKLADFGVARAANRGAKTGERIIKGKMGYMSPEQALCKPVDHRSDVFSLGVVLYETTTGKKLFSGASDYEVLSKVVRGTVPPPSSIRRFYPAGLEAVVMRALEKDPANRYSTAREVITDLSRVAREIRLTVGRGALARFMRELFAEVDEDPASPAVGSMGKTAADTEVMRAPPRFVTARRLAPGGSAARNSRSEPVLRLSSEERSFLEQFEKLAGERKAEALCA